MARSTRTFSDIDLNFGMHPVTHDVVLKYDDQAIKASVRNLVLTQNYERPFHSEIGSQIRGLLFENATPMLDIMLKRAITDTIVNFEPRVKLNDVVVTVSPDNYEVYVSIYFTIINTTRPQQVDLILTRSR
jgi:phage baseplate assembly protein W